MPEDARVYFFVGMQDPQTGPRDEGRKPKFAGAKNGAQDTAITFDSAQALKFTLESIDGDLVEVPGTLLGMPNRSYLGHTSDLVETPWQWEDRWTGNDPHFRRIPAQASPSWMLMSKSERKKMRAEVRRLAAIENPGNCVSRRRWIDGWCKKSPTPGGTKCRWHASSTEKIIYKRRAEAAQLQEQAQRIMEQRKSRRTR